MVRNGATAYHVAIGPGSSPDEESGDLISEGGWTC